MTFLRAILAGAAASALLFTAASAAWYAKFDGVDGSSKGEEVKIESIAWGASGGSSPAGDGPGTLVAVMQPSGYSAALQRLARDGGEIASMTVTGEEAGKAVEYKLERCFVKSWSTSGDADDRPTEEVAFYYNKIAVSYAKTSDGKSLRN